MTSVVQVVLGECDDEIELVGDSCGIDQSARALFGHSLQLCRKGHELNRRFRPRRDELDGVDDARGYQVSRPVISLYYQAVRGMAGDGAKQSTGAQVDPQTMLVAEKLIKGADLKSAQGTPLALRDFVLHGAGFDLLEGEDEFRSYIVLTRLRIIWGRSLPRVHLLAIATNGARLNVGFHRNRARSWYPVSCTVDCCRLIHGSAWSRPGPGGHAGRRGSDWRLSTVADGVSRCARSIRMLWPASEIELCLGGSSRSW